MEKYCRTCPNRGSAICELPSITERVGRYTLHAIRMLEEAVAVGCAAFTGTTLPVGYGIQNRTDAGIEAMNTRVAGCVLVHKALESEGLL